MTFKTKGLERSRIDTATTLFFQNKSLAKSLTVFQYCYKNTGFNAI